MEKPEKKFPNKPERKVNPPIQKVEYIRKNERKKKFNSTTPPSKKKNEKKKGRKKGVLWAGIDPSNKDQVIIGFSLCHSLDRFDYINNRKTKGFGLDTAKTRAEKWKFHNAYFVQKTFTQEEIKKAKKGEIEILKHINPDCKSCVEVAPSIIVKLKPFIERCRKYYKDKGFPEWINKIEKDQPVFS